MTDLIVVAIILLIVGIAVTYIVKEKKKGVKCIGCPAAGACAHKCSSAGEHACSGSCGHCGGHK